MPNQNSSHSTSNQKQKVESIDTSNRLPEIHKQSWSSDAFNSSNMEDNNDDNYELPKSTTFAKQNLSSTNPPESKVKSLFITVSRLSLILFNCDNG